MSMKWRAAIATGLLAGASLAALAWFQDRRASQDARTAYQQWGAAVARECAALAGQGLAERDDLWLANRFEQVTAGQAVQSLMVADLRGVITWHSDSHREGQASGFASAEDRGSSWPVEASTPLLECWAPVVQRDRKIGTAILRFTTESLRAADRRRHESAMVMILGLTLAAAAGAWALAGGASRRLKILDHGFKQLAEGLQPAPTAFPSSVREIRELEEDLKRTWVFLADLHHELDGARDSLQRLPSLLLDQLAPLFPQGGWMAFDGHNRLIAANESIRAVFGGKCLPGAHLLDIVKDEALQDLLRRSTNEPGLLHRVDWNRHDVSALSLSGRNGFPPLSIVLVEISL